MSHPTHAGRRLDGPEWKRQRQAFLADNPSCRRCGKPSSVVDHIKAHSGNARLFWDHGNWQALCVPCHNAKNMAVDVRAKTDNSYFGSKLDLRRHFLRTYHSDGDIRVMDCCQGSGCIWDTLRREFRLSSYWGIDTKPKAGRIQLDSSRILCQPGWRENVIDVDTYGSPWKHWQAICATLDHPASVFLTVGFVRMFGAGNMSLQERAALGIPKSMEVPRGMLSRLHDLSIDYCLALAHQRLRVVEATEALPCGNARYFGLRLEPSTT